MRVLPRSRSSDLRFHLMRTVWIRRSGNIPVLLFLCKFWYDGWKPAVVGFS